MPEVSPTDASVRLQASAERPWLFGLLIAPMAVVSNGVIGGALSYLLRRQGVGPARGAEIIALLNLPQTIYFLWSPVTDFWVRRRTWLIVAALAAAAAMLAALCQPVLASSPAIALMFLSACFGQIVVASCGGMMGALHGEANRRRASSFYQAGSLAFGAGAVFVLAMLAERLSNGWLGLTTSVMIALPAFAALATAKQESFSEDGFRKTVQKIWSEFRETFLCRRALPYTLAMLFPMGTGAMIQLLPGLAADYHIGGSQIAWINGVAGSLLTAAGALTASLVPSRIRAPIAWILTCLANAASLLVLWIGPQRPEVYLVGAMLFLFTIGACYALFTAVVLEFLGHSGKSGSSRYSIINSLGNVPVVYMVLLDGKGYGQWGARGMVGTDIALSLVGGSILLLIFLKYRQNDAGAR